MQNEKLLTISIASYNVEKCLAYCLDSLILKNENFKLLDIIIVNDGSKDGTLSVAKKYIDMFPDVFRVVDKENGGYGSTINSSIAIAKGKYYKLLDADDLFDTDGLNNLIDFIKNKSNEVDLIISKYIKNYTDVNRQEIITDFKEKVVNKSITLDYFNSIPAMHSICVKTNCIRDMHIQEHCFYTDNEYVAYVLLHTKNFSTIDSCIYIYNLGLNDQSVSVNGLRKHLRDWNNVYRAIKKMFDDSNANYNCIEMIQKIQKELVYAMYLAYLVQKNSYQYKKELMNIDAFIKSEDVEIYKLTNQIKVVKALRISKFYLYRLLSKEITRRMETTK